MNFFFFKKKNIYLTFQANLITPFIKQENQESLAVRHTLNRHKPILVFIKKTLSLTFYFLENMPLIKSKEQDSQYILKKLFLY